MWQYIYKRRKVGETEKKMAEGLRDKSLSSYIAFKLEKDSQAISSH